MKELLKKLSEVKAEIGKISKDSKNPFYKSKYFDINGLLEHVEPLLHKNGLVLLQPITDGCVSSKIYDVDTGESVSSCLPLPTLTDPQKLGSAISYYRRYSLSSLLAVQAEDDDGNKASSKPAPMKKRLDEKGFNFLMSEGTIDQIESALKTRTINKPFQEQLDNRLTELQNTN